MILVHLTHFDDYFCFIWVIFMIHFGPFGSFRWSGSLYFASGWYILLIILLHLIRFDLFWWFILVHLDHFGDQVLSILPQFGTFWQSILVHLIHFYSFWCFIWSIWIISLTKFSLFYFISLILDDFSTFCPLILVHLTHFDDYFCFIWVIFMIHFGPFGSFRWSGSLYFASGWYILTIILLHLIRFDSFWWFILVHLDRFSDQHWKEYVMSNLCV